MAPLAQRDSAHSNVRLRLTRALQPFGVFLIIVLAVTHPFHPRGVLGLES